jgi:hypothetical protein
MPGAVRSILGVSCGPIRRRFQRAARGRPRRRKNSLHDQRAGAVESRLPLRGSVALSRYAPSPQAVSALPGSDRLADG